MAIFFDPQCLFGEIYVAADLVKFVRRDSTKLNSDFTDTHTHWPTMLTLFFFSPLHRSRPPFCSPQFFDTNEGVRRPILFFLHGLCAPFPPSTDIDYPPLTFFEA